MSTLPLYLRYTKYIIYLLLRIFAIGLDKFNVFVLRLKIYQQQVIKFHQKLSLDRDRASDLYWSDTLLKLCNDELLNINLHSSVRFMKYKRN